jgi:hypothetical protein
MTGIIHESILTKAIDIIETSGLRVIRIDKRKHPDAIAIDFNTRSIIAIEAETNPTGIYLTRRAYLNIPQGYDDEIIVTTQLASPRIKSMNAYRLCLSLRTSGKTIRDIKRTIKTTLGEDVAIGTLHKWICGNSKPLSNRINSSLPITLQ